MENNFEHSSTSSAGSETHSDSSLGSGSDDDDDSDDEEERRRRALEAFGSVEAAPKKKKKRKGEDASGEEAKAGKGKTKVKVVKEPAKVVTKTVERALVPIEQSGIVFEIEVNPGEEDAAKEAERAKNRKVFGGDSLIDIPDNELEEEQRGIKRMQIQEVENRKKRQKLLKEIMSKYKESDKVKTHAFLMKHGLTEAEALKYTQLNTDFDVRTLTKAQKHWLDTDFHAQVYAFRKLRDKLIIDDMGLGNLYKPSTYKPPGSPQAKAKDLQVAVAHKIQQDKIELAHRKLSAKPQLF